MYSRVAVSTISRPLGRGSMGNIVPVLQAVAAIDPRAILAVGGTIGMTGSGLLVPLPREFEGMPHASILTCLSTWHYQQRCTRQSVSQTPTTRRMQRCWLSARRRRGPNVRRP